MRRWLGWTRSFYFRIAVTFVGFMVAAATPTTTSGATTTTASLAYNQDSTVSRYFLAELLVDEHRVEEARAELKRVIDAPFDPEWAPEDRDYKVKATALLKDLASKR